MSVLPGQPAVFLNPCAALNRLQRLGYAFSALDLGGNSGRKITFCSATGRVLLKRLRANR